MPKLQEVLEKQREILNKAQKLGFKSVRLCKSIEPGKLDVMLDMDREDVIDQYDTKSAALRYQLIQDLGCQIVVCTNAYFDESSRNHFCREGIKLPCRDQMVVNKVFGEDFYINPIKDDLEFNENIECYKEAYETFCSIEKTSEASTSDPLTASTGKEKAEILETISTSQSQDIQPFLKRCKLEKDGDKLPAPGLAFRRAAAAGLEDVTRALAENAKSLDINQPGPESGKTALHFAAVHKRKEVISQLIQMGAKQDIRDAQGKLASHYVEDEELKKLFKAG